MKKVSAATRVERNKAIQIVEASLQKWAATGARNRCQGNVRPDDGSGKRLKSG